MSKFVECKDAPDRQVLFDGFECVTGRFVEIEVEVGKGNHCLLILLQVLWERLADVTSDDHTSPNVSEMFAGFVRTQNRL